VAYDVEHSPDEWAELLDELTRLESLGYLKGEGESERRAILRARSGDVYFKLSRIDEAIAAYQHTIALDSEKAYPYSMLGKVYAESGRYNEALTVCQQAIALDPMDEFLYSRLGIVYRALGRTDEAKWAHQQAIALAPKAAYLHIGLGAVYQILQQHENALKEYQAAVQLDPQDGSFRGSLVGILRKLGREAEAQEHINIARKLIVKENEYGRACFESICGNTDAALALLKVALEKKQASLEWARRDPDFDFIREDVRFKALVAAE